MPESAVIRAPDFMDKPPQPRRHFIVTVDSVPPHPWERFRGCDYVEVDEMVLKKALKPAPKKGKAHV